APDGLPLRAFQPARPAGPPRPQRSGLCSWLRLSGSALNDGQCDREACAPRRVGGGVDRTGMMLNDAQTDMQSQPCAFADIFRGEKRLLDRLRFLPRYPAAIVAHLDHGALAVMRGVDRQRSAALRKRVERIQ